MSLVTIVQLYAPEPVADRRSCILRLGEFLGDGGFEDVTGYAEEPKVTEIPMATTGVFRMELPRPDVMQEGPSPERVAEIWASFEFVDARIGPTARGGAIFDEVERHMPREIAGEARPQYLALHLGPQRLSTNASGVDHQLGPTELCLAIDGYGLPADAERFGPEFAELPSVAALRAALERAVDGPIEVAVLIDT